MNPRIRTALINCEAKESKIDSLMKSLGQAKGYAIPVALTLGVTALTAGVPAAASAVEFLGTTVNHLKAFEAAEPGIFYGLASGLVAMGGILAGVGYLEKKDGQKNGQQKDNHREINESILSAWDQIVKNDAQIAHKAANQQLWVSYSVSRGSPLSKRILEDRGIDVENRAALLDLQKAYIHGVKCAFVMADKDGRRAELGNGTFDQYTNKNIVRGMVSYYKQAGHSISLDDEASISATQLAKKGFEAILKIGEAQVRSDMYKKVEPSAFERS